jgi:hypothetical protein
MERTAERQAAATASGDRMSEPEQQEPESDWSREIPSDDMLSPEALEHINAELEDDDKP